ncbi:MAG TPA: 3-hydroxybutyrate oligomer hydrolase family protein, partial [Myxococcales bacterium]|nr:3-hydroxybutyrate oligomer hydrolase family protein [Myxococcales bacterium]
GAIVTTSYDGTTDDLLTGGLGKSGLGFAALAPGFANPASPTAAELRRLAIYQNYRALLDTSTAGGYGVLYGPNIDVQGGNTLGEGKIAGEETIAFDDDGTGQVNATMMVQVPASFDPQNPCIVAVTSSGSRGIYGAVATAGEWGLKHGCAVTYSDKGSGMGVDDLMGNTVNVLDGTRAVATSAGSSSNFTASLSDADRAALNQQLPNRFAVKHAHSQQNPEKDWGRYTLHAVEFAFYVLNSKFGQPTGGGTVRTVHPGQAIVIAAGVSNGGGAALAAAEQDTQALISGVVAGEPQVQVVAAATIQRAGATVATSGKSLFDYTTYANLYQACATQASAYSGLTASTLGPAFDATAAAERCQSLRDKGLLSAQTGDTTTLANEALARLNQYGWEPQSNLLHLSHFASYATPAVAVTYANAYSRASVKDRLCGYSFAMVDATGAPQAVSASAGNQSSLAQIFANGNGLPPMSTIQLVNDDSLGGPRRDQVSLNASSKNDYNADGAACLRSLSTGTTDSGAPLSGSALDRANAVKEGIQQVLRSAQLRGVPTILVQGRADALVPVNHASRAYFGANRIADGPDSPTVYYEVDNAQHFDAFLTLSGLSTRYVPLQPYVIRALDLMYARLKSGAALPPSQLVHTTPRSSALTQLSAANVPPIPASPAAADLIGFANDTVSVP